MKQKPPKRITQRKLLSILVGSVFVLLLVGLTTLFYVATRSYATPNATAPIHGTWQRDSGSSIIHFRPDGTTRIRDGSARNSDFEYIEWTPDENNEFRTFHPVSQRSNLWKSRINNWVHGQFEPNLDVCKFNQISDNEFEIIVESSDGEKVSLAFTATSDDELEASP